MLVGLLLLVLFSALLSYMPQQHTNRAAPPNAGGADLTALKSFSNLFSGSLRFRDLEPRHESFGVMCEADAVSAVS